MGAWILSATTCEVPTTGQARSSTRAAITRPLKSSGTGRAVRCPSRTHRALPQRPAGTCSHSHASSRVPGRAPSQACVGSRVSCKKSRSGASARKHPRPDGRVARPALSYVVRHHAHVAFTTAARARCYPPETACRISRRSPGLSGTSRLSSQRVLSSL